MADDKEKDHDSNISIEEVLKRIAAAEALLAEAKGLLSGEVQTTAVKPAAQEAEHKGSESPKELKPKKNLVDGEFDEELLRRYEPPGSTDDFRMIIHGLFNLVLQPPSDRAHLAEALRRLMHSDAITGPRSLENVLRFGWTRFSKYSGQYLSESNEAGSFHVSKTQPTDINEAAEIKVFLEAKGRGPVPITIRRDEAFEKAWRVHAFSL